MDDLTTERSFDSKAARVIDAVGLSFYMLSMGACTTRRLADVRSTDTGIKCLYCIFTALKTKQNQNHKKKRSYYYAVILYACNERSHL